MDEEKDMTQDKIKKLEQKLKEEQALLEACKKNKDNLMLKLEQHLSVAEKKKLDSYIEIEIFKRRPTEEEKKMVDEFNDKGSDFKTLVFEFHTEDTNRIDKILTIQELQEKIEKLKNNLKKEEGKGNQDKVVKKVDPKVEKQRIELKKLIEENNELEKKLVKARLEASAIKNANGNNKSKSCIIF